MGVVYKAQDTKLDRLVALKFLPPHLAADEQDKRRFIHEAKAASALDHPNICTIHEIDETPSGELFIAMALYEGTPLNKKIDQGPLKIDEALEIAIQTAEGLQAAHEKGITHRDIKSSNIMITEKGRAVVMDFGLARTTGATKLTKTGATLGTVPCMSPEQARGEKADHRTDIWSFGVVLYEMITGRLPFKSEYDEAVVYSILNQNPEPVTSLRSGVPMELEGIINKCLEKKASDRYQHSDELLVDLRKVAQKTTTQVKLAKRRLKPVWIAAPILLLSLIGLYFLLSLKDEAERIDSLAVLPLKNLTGDPGQDYFVEGMHEALTAELSKISALKVISRTSAMRYKNTDKAMPEIARELGVTGLVEGSVLRMDGQVRVTVQVIHGPSDRHLWAQSYQRDVRDVLGLYGEVIKGIAGEIAMTLTPQEQGRLSVESPVDPQAYDAFLQGNAYLRRWSSEAELRNAVTLFQQAIALDSTFALAYAQLSQAHAWLFWWWFDRSNERLAQARAAAEQALLLSTDLPEGHTVLGLTYMCELDVDRAWDHYSAAVRLQPNNAELHLFIGYAHATRSEWDKAVASAERAIDLDPYDAGKLRELAFYSIRLKRYAEADALLARAIALHPDGLQLYILKASLWVRAEGTTENARAIIRDAVARFGEDKVAKAALPNTPLLLLFDDEYPSTVARLSRPSTFSAFTNAATFYLGKADFLRHRGHDLLARAHYDSARVVADSLLAVAQRTAAPPGNYVPALHSQLGLAYAGLGRKAEAIHHGQTAVDLLPLSKSGNLGTTRLAALARIYAMVGEVDAAIDRLELLLSVPSDVSRGSLQVDPEFAPLRSHPRFQALLKKIELDK